MAVVSFLYLSSVLSANVMQLWEDLFEGEADVRPMMIFDHQDRSGACPGGLTRRLGFGRHEDGIPRRTGTRPPHPPNPTPCPYRRRLHIMTGLDW